jgi:hypothetical protein
MKCVFILNTINNMTTVIGDVTTEFIKLIHTECLREKNKKRLKMIFFEVKSLVFNEIKPYLYTIMAILILMFVMNCFQFYYYISNVIN